MQVSATGERDGHHTYRLMYKRVYGGAKMGKNSINLRLHN